MKKFWKGTAVAALSVVLALGLYWIKCQNRIDFISNFNWEDHLPLHFLQKQTPVINAAAAVDLIAEDFNDGSLSDWSRVWSPSRTVRARIGQEGSQGSKYVEIRSRDERWSFQHGSLIQVKPGQRLSFRIRMKKEGAVLANAGMVLYDSERRVIDWHFAMSDPDVSSEWAEFGQEFTVPDAPRYMRFRASGSGRGSVFLDDVQVKAAA